MNGGLLPIDLTCTKKIPIGIFINQIHASNILSTQKKGNPQALMRTTEE